MTATPSPEELVERLEARAADCDQQVRHAVWPALAQQAIDEASLLRAAAALIRELVSQRKELREALKPFADNYEIRRSLLGAEPDDTNLYGIAKPITSGDLRRAAEALGEKP